MRKDKEYLIKYKTFDQLLSEVRDDMQIYDTEGMIDSSRLIKVVRSLNKKLGLKINKEKEGILQVKESKVKLPEDFSMLNFALLCLSYQVITPKIQGIYTEDFWVQLDCEKDIDGTSIIVPATEKCKVMKNSKGDLYTVMQRFQNEVREYTYFDILRIKTSSGIEVHNGCFNLTSGSPNEVQIENGWMYTNFCEGTIYINYLGDLVDDEGNLLVLDHPVIQEYYEYALKRRILENLYIDKGEDVVNKLALIEQRFTEARRVALSLVNTPEFSELQDIWLKNRQQYYKRYFLPITGRL